MMKRKAGLVLIIAVVLSGLHLRAFAQGNLLVAPIRVVFEGSKQKEDLNLTNIGQDTSVYLVSFIHYEMQVDGSFKQLDNVDTLTTRADKYLRIFPRKVVLPPGESQTIRMQYRKPSDMADGEFRSHLYFRAEKDVSALGMKNVKADTTNMSVQITPIFGISIPVIIRNGKTNLTLSLSDVNMTPVNDTLSTLTFHINRLGNRSAYGNLKAIFVPNSGQAVDIGLANGVGLYTDIAQRQFSMTVRTRRGLSLKNGKIVITYSKSSDEGGEELCKTEFRVP